MYRWFPSILKVVTIKDNNLISVGVRGQAEIINLATLFWVFARVLSKSVVI
jgi:hypothetical protein